MPDMYTEHDESESIIPIAIPDSMPNLQNLDAELRRVIRGIVKEEVESALQKVLRDMRMRTGWPHYEHKGAH